MQSSRLFRGILHLISGKVLTQGLSFLILPALTRLYPPESFGALSLFLSTVSILSIIATLNYDVGVTAAENEEEATATLIGTWLCMSVFCLLLGGTINFIPYSAFDLVGLAPLFDYKALIPVGIWLTTLFASLNYYVLKSQKFAFIAKVGVAQSVTQAVVQLTAAAMKLLGMGLILGDLIKNFVASVVFARSEKDNLANFVAQGKHITHVLPTLKKLRQFPAYGMPSDLIITLGVALPAFFISKVWDPATLGFFLVAQKIYDVPLLLVGGPVGRVFLSESMRLNQEEPDKLFGHFKKTSLHLLGLSLVLVPGAVLAFYFLSVPFLGKSWGESGAIALSMLPLAMTRFVTSPLSQISAVIKKQNVEFYVSLARLVLVAGSFAAFAHYQVPLKTALFIYALVSAGMYLVFYGVYFYLVRERHLEKKNNV